MKVLVTGGAGYIGAVTTHVLLERGHLVVVLDDLSTGHRAAVSPRARFVHGRIQDPERLAKALHNVDAVVHFASLSLVGDSIVDPRRYFRENLGAAIALLDGMHHAGVHKLVFSSSAAVYGAPDVEVIDEDATLAPVNPYGHSKVTIERMLTESARADSLAAISLRYFNACGAHAGLGEDHRPETHLVPRLCARLLGRLDRLDVFGDDYPTADGTAVRDYVHVLDLAQAHAQALEVLEPGVHEAINLGTGRGATVKEMVSVAEEVAGQPVHPTVGPRRRGDPARLVASCARAAQRLRWRAEHSDPRRIVSDALAWHREHPQGYTSA